MREAERTLKIMLGSKFPAAWIAEHCREVLGQAHVEYQEWLETNPPARRPVGWLCNCAYHRAQNLRDSERRRPNVDSLDTVFHVPDESTPTPEQEVIDRDRQERLRKALSHLPEKEIKLLALVYFEDNSIREAGRKLGWQKSAADRHHNTAMEKLRSLVGDDRSLFSPATLGLVAYLACRGGRVSPLVDAVITPVRELLAIGAELASVAGRRISDLARALFPFSNAGAAAANSGVGRAAGVCGAGIVTLVCVGAASVIAPGQDSLHSPGERNSHRVSGPVRPPATVAPALAAPELPVPEPSTPVAVERDEAPKVNVAPHPHARQRQAPPAGAPAASAEQVESEFGIEGGSGSTETTPAPAPESTPQRSTFAPPPSSPEPSPKPSGSSAAREFGL